jgi:large subunit ribosomal protein L24
MKLKTGDKVRILAGKDKGKEGKIIQVFPKLERVVVEGINLQKRHLRGRGGERQGQVITFPCPIHVSNTALVSGKSGMVGRVGYARITQEGKQVKIRQVRRRGAKEDIE